MRHPRAKVLMIAALATLTAAQEPSSVSVEKGRLTVRARNAPIRGLLEEFESKTRIRIVVAEEIEEVEVSADFAAVPLDIGLRALLGNYDAFFYYGGSSDDPPSLRAVWVFPKGAAASLRPVPPEAWAGARELERAVAHPDPHMRQQAYEALMKRPDSSSRDLLIQAIRGVGETDDGLRQTILSAAVAKGVDIPPDVLFELARADSSEHVRWMALDALAQHPAAREAARTALTDASPAVRQRAADILIELDAEAQRAKGMSRPPEQQP
jgi:HEAT repeat protein